VSHRTTVYLIADQIININGTEYNIHDIDEIFVSGDGLIEEVCLIDRGDECNEAD